MVVQKEPARLDDGIELPSGCRHYWIIEPAKGPVSVGVCRICRETKEFRNSINDMDRDSFDLTPYGQDDKSGYAATFY